VSVENPAVPLSQVFEDSDLYDALAGDGPTASGVRVTRRRVLGYSAVWRSVCLISSAVGRLPVELYRWIESADGKTTKGREVDYRHPARRVLRRPSEGMTPIVFRKTLQSHALTEGNGYAYIVRDPLTQTPTELLILDPRRTWPVRVDGVTWYVSECGDPVPGKRRKFGLVKIPAADMIHIMGLGSDGLCGFSVFKVLKETFGTALASRDYGARYFGNDSRPGIALVVPASMKDETVTKLRESWERLHKGVKQSHRAAILRDGVTLQTFGAGARDAQLMENRAFDAREIAVVFGVPPHKVGDPSRTAYNSLEAENQSWLDDTLDDWLVTWEQELELKLLTEEQKDAESHVIEFTRRKLLRTNLSARGAYYQQATMGGWMNRDEVREEEGYNPIPDGKGEVFTLAVNLAPAAAVDSDPAADPDAPPASTPPADPPAAPSADDASRANPVGPLLAAVRGMAVDSLARMVRRLGTGAERAASRPAALSAYLAGGARAEHHQVLTAAALPFVQAARAAGRTTAEPAAIADQLLADLADAVRPRIGRASDLPAAVREAVAAVAASSPARVAGDLFPE
jgi:HK97 family phage portal protein